MSEYWVDISIFGSEFVVELDANASGRFRISGNRRTRETYNPPVPLPGYVSPYDINALRSFMGARGEVLTPR